MKHKVTFYMKSGNKIIMKFDSFEISKLSLNEGNRREMSWENSEDVFTIDIDEIESVIIKKVLF